MTMIIGLTGSIATGKSTAAKMLRSLRIPVFDADKQVHQLMQQGSPAYAQIASLFPQVIEEDAINRQKLGTIVFADAQAKQKLEAILHPKIRAAEEAFICQANLARRDVIVLDIPLLYETGTDDLCDHVWLMHCPAFLQKQRAMRRSGMSEAKWRQIVQSQMPQSEKRRYADAVIQSGIGKGAMMRQIKQLLKQVSDA